MKKNNKKERRAKEIVGYYVLGGGAGIIATSISNYICLHWNWIIKVFHYTPMEVLTYSILGGVLFLIFGSCLIFKNRIK